MRHSLMLIDGAARMFISRLSRRGVYHWLCLSVRSASIGPRACSSRRAGRLGLASPDLRSAWELIYHREAIRAAAPRARFESDADGRLR